MFIRHPPRRDPRVLGLELVASGLSWTVVDAHDVRGCGTEDTRVTRLAILRLICREKPTALAATPEIWGIAKASAARFGLPAVPLPKRAIPRASLRLLFAHIDLLAPSQQAARLLGRAVRVLLEVQLPPRTYARNLHPVRPPRSLRQARPRHRFFLRPPKSSP